MSHRTVSRILTIRLPRVQIAIRHIKSNVGAADDSHPVPIHHGSARDSEQRRQIIGNAAGARRDMAGDRREAPVNVNRGSAIAVR